MRPDAAQWFRVPDVDSEVDDAATLPTNIRRQCQTSDQVAVAGRICELATILDAGHWHSPVDRSSGAVT